MSNILFLYENLFDLATLTESSEEDGYPVENLKVPFRTKVWKTDGSTPGTANLVIDHGAATPITVAALVNYNWGAAPSTLDLEFNATDSWGAPSATEALTWVANPDTYGNPNIIIKTFASKNYRYNRLNVVHSPGDWDLGRIFLGTYFEPARHFRFQHSEQIIDPSYADLTVDGQEHVDMTTKYRERNVKFRTSSYSQYRLFQQMINEIGLSQDCIIAFDYDNYPNEQTIYGKIKKYSQEVIYTLYDLSILFRESR